MGNSSIWVLAVVTSSALLTLTHEEADYYMMCERIVTAPALSDLRLLLRTLNAIPYRGASYRRNNLIEQGGASAIVAV